VDAAAREVCEAYGIDPLTTLSEGALLLTVSEEAKKAVAAALARRGSAVTEVGRVEEGDGLWSSDGGRARRRERVGDDGYWRAYSDLVGP